MGAKPDLKWIDIDRLVVDHDYQRPIRGKGAANVRKIAAQFKWSCFTPVIVAMTSGGKYAVVDGQHRTTAALLVGIKAVPCMVISATPNEQAAAFKAINDVTTRLSRQALHAASKAAGDADALALEDVARRAEVTILRYPLAADQQSEGGMTMAIGCLERSLRVYGRDVLVTALQCVTQTENNQPGLLISAVIRALCEVVSAHPEWRDGGSRLLESFDQIDIEGHLEKARSGPRPKGTGVHQMLARSLSVELRSLFPTKAAA